MSKKPQKGQLTHREGLGFYGRFYAIVEGERVRICKALHTENKAVAKRKLERLIASSNPTQEDTARPETFQEAAGRVVDQQKKEGMATWKDREQRLTAYVFPSMGSVSVDKVKAQHVRTVLENARELGKSRQTLVHIKNDVSTVLGELWRSELLPENVCARVEVPKVAGIRKERAVLTDEELIRYLGWQHPDERFSGSVLERQTMACVSRMFGGLRTGDLHALDWSALHTESGAFEWGFAARQKTKRPQRLAIPGMLRPILRDWWERHGRPTEGPVFPLRRGDHAGAKRGKTSHAFSFRRDLRRAFGIDAPVPVVKVRKNGRPLTRYEWTESRPLNARERLLLEGGEYVEPVDFHSWRRAYAQALADANVNEQQAQALAGHSTGEAHRRYLQNSDKMRTMPEAALPGLKVGHSTKGTLSDGSQKPADYAGEPKPVDMRNYSAFVASDAALGAGCWWFKSTHPDP